MDNERELFAERKKNGKNIIGKRGREGYQRADTAAGRGIKARGYHTDTGNSARRGKAGRYQL